MKVLNITGMTNKDLMRMSRNLMNDILGPLTHPDLLTVTVFPPPEGTRHDLRAILTDPADSFKRGRGIERCDACDIERCDACGRFAGKAECKCGCTTVRYQALKKYKKEATNV